MEATFQSLTLGLGAGAVYAALALGIVLTYQSAGIINFAFGAMAMFPTYVFTNLRLNGVLQLPWIWLPSTITFSGPLSLWPALLLSLAVAALLGVAVHFLVFRPLRNAPALARVVGSIGVFVLLQGLALLKFGTGNVSVPQVLPNEPVHVSGVVIPRDRLYLAIIAVGATVLLLLLYRFTKFGLATRASAQSGKGASLLGYSPTRIALVNWVLASMVAALLGILVGPVTALSPTNFTLLIVPALAAALIARFKSFAVACAGALIIGMLQSELLHLASIWTWLPQVGLGDALPFIIVILLMAVGRGRLPQRGDLVDGRLPRIIRSAHPAIPGVIATVLAVVIAFVLTGPYLSAYITTLINIVMCLSFVVVVGFAGQISLAQMTFAGVAALTLSKFSINAGIPFPLAPILSVIVCVVAGLIVGLPAIRLRGIALAVATIGLAVAVSNLVFGNPSYTGGFLGSKVPAPEFAGLQLGNGEDRGFAIMAVVVVVVSAGVVVALQRSGTGLRMFAVRSNERAAAGSGIAVTRLKLIAFAVSAGLAGLAGVMFGYQQQTLSLSAFDVFASLALLASAYLGGITSVSGAVIGGFVSGGGLIFYWLDQEINFGSYELLVSGLGLIVMAILNPEGVAGIVHAAIRGFRPRRRRRPLVAAAPTKPAVYADAEHA